MSNYQYASIGSDDGSAPIRRRPIIWTNGGLVYWRMYASLNLSELTEFMMEMALKIP